MTGKWDFAGGVGEGSVFNTLHFHGHILLYICEFSMLGLYFTVIYYSIQYCPCHSDWRDGVKLLNEHDCFLILSIELFVNIGDSLESANLTSSPTSSDNSLLV